LSTTRLSIAAYTKGILAGDRVIIGKAISLVESDLPSDQNLASQLIETIFDKTGNAIRIGVSGAPGVGKSTFIEAFGEYITSLEKKIAVLTIDPTSRISGGSILGDKTRMENLSKNPLAFIRPSASGGILGGVGSKTREAMLICEAAGYEVIIIETVGVGQSEIEVKNMVDFFLLLMLAGAGDELQGIKKGIMEIADAVVITKADGDNVKHAAQARAEYQQAVHLQRAKTPGWTTPVMTCSALSKSGITEIWKMILSFKEKTSSSGEFHKTRKLQNISWLHELFRQSLSRDYLQYDEVNLVINEISSRIGEGKISPHQGAQQVLAAYHRAIQGSKS
jgi:LAO/AO transport system kinase